MRFQILAWQDNAMGKRRPKISQSQMAKQPGQGNLISRRHTKKHNLKVQNSNFRAVSPNVTDGGPQGKKENQEKVTSPTMSPNSEKNLTEAEIQVNTLFKVFENQSKRD